MSFLVVTTTLVWLLPIKICHAEYWNKPGVPGTGTCKWRWQVGFQGACGGTLIAPNWIISAAHCAKKKNMNTGKVGSDPGKVQNFKVKRWITHPKYKDPVGNAHNIALVEIDGAVKTNECVGFAMLPKTRVKAEKKTVVTGLAKSSTLQGATVTTWSNDNCKKADDGKNGQDGPYGPYGDQITDDQLCAAGTDPTDQCQSDGGGPLLFEESDGNFTIHGVTSWGRGCEKEYPGVWSRVYEHMDFLDEHLKGGGSGCEDTNNGKKDNDGDDCSWYTEFDPAGEECGLHDNKENGFQANEMCCHCGGGKKAQPTPAPTPSPNVCKDADGGATDADRFDCEWYTTKGDEHGKDCGLHDDDDFKANKMCCRCGGGSTGNPPPAPAPEPPAPAPKPNRLFEYAGSVVPAAKTQIFTGQTLSMAAMAMMSGITALVVVTRRASRSDRPETLVATGSDEELTA